MAFTVLLGLSIGGHAQSQAKGVLIVQSTPGGAQVYVDDAPMGTTSPEGRLRLSLSPGKHMLRLSETGYQDAENTIALRPGQVQTKQVLLTQSQGSQAVSNNGPTLQETLAWVETQLTQHGGYELSVEITGSGPYCDSCGYDYSDRERYPSFTDSGCTLSWATATAKLDYLTRRRNGESFLACMVCKEREYSRWSQVPNNFSPTAASFTFSRSAELGQFSPKYVVTTVDAYSYDPKFDNERSTVFAGTGRHVRLAFPTTDGKSNISFEFEESERDMANRIGRALGHAIELCGGKEEPF